MRIIARLQASLNKEEVPFDKAEKKRIYMRAYAQRPYVLAKRKKYSFSYNAEPKNKLKRHEWYVQKKIKDNENDNLHAINAERFTNV